MFLGLKHSCEQDDGCEETGAGICLGGVGWRGAGAVSGEPHMTVWEKGHLCNRKKKNLQTTIQSCNA